MSEVYKGVFEVQFADGEVIEASLPGMNLDSVEHPYTSSRSDTTGRGKFRILEPTEIKDSSVSFPVKWVDAAASTRQNTDRFCDSVGQTVSWRDGPYGKADNQTKYSATGFISSVQRTVVDEIWHLNVTIECTSLIDVGVWSGGV